MRPMPLLGFGCIRKCLVGGSWAMHTLSDTNMKESTMVPMLAANLPSTWLTPVIRIHLGVHADYQRH